jgi:23S rRNA pseudouridine1911/1915/1917 synthase
MSDSNHRVSSKEAGQSLRQLLKAQTGLSSKACNALIDKGKIKVDSKVERFGSVNLRLGQVLSWEALPTVASSSKASSVVSTQKKSESYQNNNPNTSSLSGLTGPESLEAPTIIYENEQILVMLKPPGIPSQRTKDPKRFNAEDLMARWAQKTGRGRVILAHRLDRDTSGLLLFGKGEAAATQLADWFKHRQIHKTYFALCYGAVERRQGTWDHFLGLGPQVGGRQSYACVKSGGLKAVTDYEVLGSTQGYSLWKLQPHTGRTHQLRVQLAHAGFPIVGDDLYGGRFSKPADPFTVAHHFLHAGELVLPLEAQCPSPLKAECPEAFLNVLRSLGFKI